MAKMKLSEELRKVEAAKEAAAIEREISLRRKQVEEQLQAKKRREEEMRKLKVRYYFVILFSNQLHMSPNYCDHCICRTWTTRGHRSPKHSGGKGAFPEELG